MKALGITSPGKGIVLYGPSGCGKTMLASIIGCEVSFCCFIIHVYMTIGVMILFLSL